MLSVRQQVLRNMLGDIDERMQLIKRNTAEVEESLYRMLQEALLQLQAQADKKVLVSPYPSVAAVGLRVLSVCVSCRQALWLLYKWSCNVKLNISPGWSRSSNTKKRYTDFELQSECDH